MLGTAFIDLHERKMLISEFCDNNMGRLESLIIQHNNSGPDSNFKVIILLKQPSEEIRESIYVTLKMLEVDFEFTTERKDWETKGL